LCPDEAIHLPDAVEKESSKSYVDEAVCVPNGMVVFLRLMGQNSHSINIQGCMVMQDLIRMEHILLIIRYILFTIPIIQILTTTIVCYYAS
jgi:hypothetical protein